MGLFFDRLVLFPGVAIVEEVLQAATGSVGSEDSGGAES